MSDDQGTPPTVREALQLVAKLANLDKLAEPDTLDEYAEKLAGNSPRAVLFVFRTLARRHREAGRRIRLPSLAILADMVAVAEAAVDARDELGKTFTEALGDLQEKSEEDSGYRRSGVMPSFVRRMNAWWPQLLEERATGKPFSESAAYAEAIGRLPDDQRKQLRSICREYDRQYLTTIEANLRPEDDAGKMMVAGAWADHNAAAESGSWSAAEVIMASVLHDHGHLGIRLPMADMNHATKPATGWPWETG